MRLNSPFYYPYVRREFEQWPRPLSYLLYIGGSQTTQLYTYNKPFSWRFKVTFSFLGWRSDPLKGLSDLQLEDEKVTLNHLVKDPVMNQSGFHGSCLPRGFLFFHGFELENQQKPIQKEAPPSRCEWWFFCFRSSEMSLSGEKTKTHRPGDMLVCWRVIQPKSTLW